MKSAVLFMAHGTPAAAFIAALEAIVRDLVYIS